MTADGDSTYRDVAVHVVLDHFECCVAEQIKELDETFASFEKSYRVNAALGRDISEGLQAFGQETTADKASSVSASRSCKVHPLPASPRESVSRSAGQRVFGWIKPLSAVVALTRLHCSK